jgi:type I restriction enzyme S subunit
MAVENNITSLRVSHCEERSKLKQSVSLNPKLRFNEFEGDWNKNKEKINIISGNTYPLNSYKNKGTLLIQGLNINPGRINIDKPIYIDEKQENLKHVFINKNDILIGLNRPIVSGALKVSIFKGKKALLYQRAGIINIKSNNIENSFFYQYLRSDIFLKKLSLELVGSDQPYIKSNLFNITKNFFPNLPEQQKIATFLTSVDTKIQQLTTKKQLLENYKKGIMQQLFSQQLRFKNEDSLDFPDWEEKKLGKICISIKSGKSKSIEGGDFPLYGSTGIIGVCENFSHDGLFILIARVGANAGTINIINDKFGVSDNTLVLDCNQNTFLHFIYYFLDFYNLNRLVFGSGQPLLTGGQLKSLKLNLPSLKEQQKIANYLIAIDTKIENVQSQIEKTQAFKKGLLQQMFV